MKCRKNQESWLFEHCLIFKEVLASLEIFGLDVLILSHRPGRTLTDDFIPNIQTRCNSSNNQ